MNLRVEWPSTAFVDETQTDDSYLLAAVVIDNRHLAALRDQIRRQQKSEPKVHWWAEGMQRRATLVALLVSLNAQHFVVVRIRKGRESDERSRRKCLAELLGILESIGVDHVLLEARERRQNERDRHALEYLRRSKLVGGGITIDHLAGRMEPLLWLADVLAGAVRSTRIESVTYDDLIVRVRVIEI